MKLKTSIISVVSAIAAAAAIAFALTGCQGAQTKIDLPAPTGKPAYLLSVDSNDVPNVYSTKGEPWKVCDSDACKKKFPVDTKAFLRLIGSTEAKGGFVLLNYGELKELGAVNVNLFKEAHANETCLPIAIIPSAGGGSARLIFPPHCTLP